MAEGSLFPAFVKFDYHTAYGVHSAIVPTRAWNPVPLVPLNVLGSYENWSSLPCDGEEMIEGLATVLAEFLPATGGYDVATVYTKDSPTAPARPRASKAIAIVGSNASTAWSKAVQQTFVFRDTEFNIAKLVILDVPTASFNPLSDISGSPEALAVVGAFTSSSWAWQSRKEFRPSTFVRLTYTLNEKLRQEYNMD